MRIPRFLNQIFSKTNSEKSSSELSLQQETAGVLRRFQAADLPQAQLSKLEQNKKNEKINLGAENVQLESGKTQGEVKTPSAEPNRKYTVYLQYDVKTGQYTLVKIEKESGLRKVLRREYHPSNNSTYEDHYDWYDYQTFKVEIVNGDPNTHYDIKIPDQILGSPKTTTAYPWTNNETWAKFKTSDNISDGIVFTSESGGNSESRHGDAEFSVNIDGLMAAIGGIAEGGPELLKVPGIEDLTKFFAKSTELAKGILNYKRMSLTRDNSTRDVRAHKLPQSVSKNLRAKIPQQKPIPSHEVHVVNDEPYAIFKQIDWHGKTHDGKDSSNSYMILVPNPKYRARN